MDALNLLLGYIFPLAVNRQALARFGATREGIADIGVEVQKPLVRVPSGLVLLEESSNAPIRGVPGFQMLPNVLTDSHEIMVLNEVVLQKDCHPSLQ